MLCKTKSKNVGYGRLDCYNIVFEVNIYLFALYQTLHECLGTMGEN
jgi:hypothetical protein